MLRIKYKNGQNITSITGKVRVWSVYDEKYKSARIHPYFVAPVIISDTWAGINRDIQIITHNGYYVEFSIDNDEINEIKALQYCDEVIFQDMDLGITHTVDKRSSDYFLFNEPERIENTNSWKISIIYRTERTVINKASASSGNYIIPGASTPVYTPFELIEIASIPEVLKESYNGLELTIKSKCYTGYSFVYYGTHAMVQSIIDEINTSISVNGTTVINYEILSNEDFGESLRKLVLNLYTQKVYTNPGFQVNLTSIVSNGVTFYSYFGNASVESIPEFIKEKNDSGVEIIIKSKSYTGKQFVYYGTSANVANIINGLNDSNVIINASAVIFYEVVSNEDLGDGLIKLILNLYTTRTIDKPVLTATAVTNSTLYCLFDNGTTTESASFTTPFEAVEVQLDTEQEKSNNEDGIGVLTYALGKKVKRAKYFLTRANANNLKYLFEKAQTITLGGVTVLENNIASYEDLEDGIIKVTVDCLMSASVDYPSAV